MLVWGSGGQNNKKKRIKSRISEYVGKNTCSLVTVPFKNKYAGCRMP